MFEEYVPSVVVALVTMMLVTLVVLAVVLASIDRRGLVFGVVVAMGATQGRRTLNSFCRKHLEQEVIVPARHLNLSLDAVARRMPFQQADGKTAEPGQIVG